MACHGRDGRTASSSPCVQMRRNHEKARRDPSREESICPSYCETLSLACKRQAEREKRIVTFSLVPYSLKRL